MKYAVAVLDIGKTNKKTVVYDDCMNELEVRKCKIETIDFHGFDVENVEAVEQWFLKQLKELNRLYPIRSVAITTHGATVVGIGKDGTPVIPTIAYTNQVPETLHQKFFALLDEDADTLQRRTATIEIKPLINIAKLLFFIKEQWPEKYEKVTDILFYPQYFAYRLTGKITADITYTGCHTYLWDFEKNDWSEVADKLGIRDKLPSRPVAPETALGTISKAVAETTGLSPDTLVTAGIHDSNSSLIPYLITQEQDFVLNSTGTWCVAMHPAEQVKFEDDEIGKMIFYNLSYTGRPVKTSILMGGLELETYVSILQEKHGRSDWPVISRELFETIIASADDFILPSVVPGTGQFPKSAAGFMEKGKFYPLHGEDFPKFWDNYEYAFAVINLSVAVQTAVALQRVGLQNNTEIFIEGGFRVNKNYQRLLVSLLPNNPIALTELKEATSFGAALCGKAMYEKRPIADFKDSVELNKQQLQFSKIAGIGKYAEKLIALSAG